MCTVIDADCILANLLQSREEVTVRELNEVRSNIERLVPSVYVDVTKNCVVWAINQRPEMFDWTDQCRATRTRIDPKGPFSSLRSAGESG